MKKRSTTQKTYFFLSSVLGLLLLGSSLLFIPLSRQWLQQNLSLEKNYNKKATSSTEVLTLIALSAEQRQDKLAAIANSNKSPSRDRARYLLATDAIAAKDGQLALKYLRNLENNYRNLAAPILLQRGKAYQLIGNNEAAVQTWQTILTAYPDSPMVAEAVYKLGQFDSKYWQLYQDKMLQFPNHPRSKEIIRQILEREPNPLDLLLVLAKYDLEDARTRERLQKDFSHKLTPKNWQTIADGYWQQGKYRAAVNAYINSPHNSRNAYRIARGLHLIGKRERAKKLYQKYIVEFSNSKPETALALKHLASLSGDRASLKYLDLAISKFPETAAANTLEKAKRLDRLKETKAAKQTRKLLLTTYSNSQIAANYRWNKAREYAAKKDLLKARELGEAIVTENSDSYLAAKASFWVGKWAEELGDEARSKRAYEYVLKHHPQSYYAWRSAVHLGWDVGNFTSAIAVSPEIERPTVRSLPPAGSDTFKELYLLGQDRDAWNYFLAEIDSKPELSVSEQFTAGLLNVSKGNYQLGTYQIWSLKNRTEATERQEWQNLRQTSQYWQTLFPLAYQEEILNWSEKRQLNPLIVTSLIRRESRFQKNIKSPVGATGLMQIMPATGEWVASKIELKNYSLSDPDDNIKMGTWYLQYTHQLYDNNSMLALASYNAGPGNVKKWIDRYGFDDPDRFVEQIPFPETKNYVEAVFGSYWNYLRIYNPQTAQLLSQYSHSENPTNFQRQQQRSEREERQ